MFIAALTGACGDAQATQPASWLAQDAGTAGTGVAELAAGSGAAGAAAVAGAKTTPRLAADAGRPQEPAADGGESLDAGVEPASDAGSGRAPATLAPVTLFIAGDSTVSNYKDTGSERDQAGWGQMLGQHFSSAVTIDNHAVGGATARRFIDEKHLADILSKLHEGDWLLVQFGTNDGNKTATYTLNGAAIPYYLDPATSFKSYLMQYVDGAREHKATPVFITPPPRNSAYCTGGDGTAAHAQAMRELGASAKVAVVDLNQKSVDYLKAICPAPMPEDFFLLKSDASVDGTHFQKHGARVLAGFVADGIREAGLRLADYLK
jgi:lysophospholipase L1-like esterase